MQSIILCVDDDKTILTALRTLLSTITGNNYRIEIAESGLEALEICEEFAAEGNEPKVVISDFIMPGMRGDELLVRLHSLYPNMTKIMLTGQSDIEAIIRVINEANLYRFIDKPFKNADLVLTAKTAINTRSTITDLTDEISSLKQRINELESKLAGSNLDNLRPIEKFIIDAENLALELKKHK